MMQNTLIDTVVTHMPHIEHLGLEVPVPELYRGHRCGSSSSIRRARDEHRLMDLVPKYKPPASCQRLPQLTVYRDSQRDRVFVGVSDARRSRLRYSALSVISEAHQ
jgi:hypothetical protein